MPYIVDVLLWVVEWAAKLEASLKARISELEAQVAKLEAERAIIERQSGDERLRNVIARLEVENGRLRREIRKLGDELERQK